MKNYAAWQEATAEDPLFVLGVQWEKGTTIKGVVENLLDRRPEGKLSNMETRVREMLDSGVKRLTNRLEKATKDAKEVMPQNHDIEQTVRGNLEVILQKHCQRVFDKCTERARSC